MGWRHGYDVTREDWTCCRQYGGKTGSAALAKLLVRLVFGLPTGRS